MGIEDTDICIIKEPDHVVVYSDDISHDSDNEAGGERHNITESYGQINETTEHHSSEESAKEYEVKECTTEVSVKVSDVINLKKCEKLTSDSEDVLSERSFKSHKTRGKHKPRDTVKNGSRPPAGNIHSRCTGSAQIKPTVPQPFSLATEKRASVGTRPAFEEDNKGNNERKSSNKRNVLSPNIFKQNQVYANVKLFTPLIILMCLKYIIREEKLFRFIYHLLYVHNKFRTSQLKLLTPIPLRGSSDWYLIRIAIILQLNEMKFDLTKLLVNCLWLIFVLLLFIHS